MISFAYRAKYSRQWSVHMHGFQHSRQQSVAGETNNSQGHKSKHKVQQDDI